MDEQIPPVFYRTLSPLGPLPKKSILVILVKLMKFSHHDASTYNVMQLCCLGDLSETSKVLLGALNDLLDF